MRGEQSRGVHARHGCATVHEQARRDWISPVCLTPSPGLYGGGTEPKRREERTEVGKAVGKREGSWVKEVQKKYARTGSVGVKKKIENNGDDTGTEEGGGS